MEAAVEKRWSVTVSNLQAWTYTILDCQLFFFFFFFFFCFFFFFFFFFCFFLLLFAVCPFRMEDWLNRLQAFIIYTVFSIKQKCDDYFLIFCCCCWSVASAASSVALHGLPEADHCGQRIEYKTRNSEAGCSIVSYRIADSSRQSSPGISPKDCFKYGKFWGVDNFSYKPIAR